MRRTSRVIRPVRTSTAALTIRFDCATSSGSGRHHGPQDLRAVHAPDGRPGPVGTGGRGDGRGAGAGGKARGMKAGYRATTCTTTPMVYRHAANRNAPNWVLDAGCRGGTRTRDLSIMSAALSPPELPCRAPHPSAPAALPSRSRGFCRQPQQVFPVPDHAKRLSGGALLGCRVGFEGTCQRLE